MNNDQEIILAKISAVYDKPPICENGNRSNGDDFEMRGVGSILR